MSRSFASVAVLVLGACSPLLGLDDVVGDRDHDRVVNERDLCPDDYDPQQLDRDADGIGDACDDCRVLSPTIDLDGDGRDDACDACIGDGAIGDDTDGDGVDDGCDACVGGVGTTGSDIDADGKDDGCDDCIELGLDRDKDGIDDHCDTCLFGPPHDEDGDSLADACDVCPADADPMQESSNDGLGVACDPDPERLDVRRMFDGFAFDDLGKWQAVSDWRAENDTMIPSGELDAQRSSFFKLRGDFVFRAGVLLTSGSLGLRVQGTFGIVVQPVSCSITKTGILLLDAIGMQTSLDTAGELELKLVRTIRGSEVAFDCIAIDQHGASAMASRPGPFFDMRISVIANNAKGAFTWVEAIDHPAMP